MYKIQQNKFINMKKLLAISPHLSTGGAPQVLLKRLELINGLYDIYVVEYSNLSNHFVVQKNKIKSIVDPDKFYTLYDNKMELINIIDNIQPDIIHMEEIPELFMDFNVANKIYKKDRKYKIIETTHSSDFIVDNKIFLPDKFVFVSQYNCFKFNKFGIPIEVVEYPVEKIKRTLESKEKNMNILGLDPNYKHILNVGLFTPRKNQSYAFDIGRQLLNEKIQIHFVGNMADNFKYYWEPLLKNKPTNCIIWGERSDVEKFYQACDMFLFASMGFRYDKELNPLVIKECLTYELPIFMFPLDVYCGKYDHESLVTYMEGNPETDANKIKEYLINMKELEQEKIQTKPDIKQKYKIKAVHLLLGGNDEREEISIRNMSKIKDYGIEYIQHYNKKYTDKPPKENCARPNDVDRLGAYSLQGPHYGNYLSFKRAVEEEFTEDTDFLIIMEGDCSINEKFGFNNFIDTLSKTFDVINDNDIKYMSFGDKYNTKTKELVSSIVSTIPNVDWMYITDKIIQVHFIIFPKSIRNFLLYTYQTAPWDVSDLYFNMIFEGIRKAITYNNFTIQYEGVSTIDNKIINDDFITLYDKDDNKIKMLLSNPYINRQMKVKVYVNTINDMNLYYTDLTLSSQYDCWIQLYDIQKYDKLKIIYKNENDEFLSTKILQINENKTYENITTNIKDNVFEQYRDKIVKEIKDIEINKNEEIYVLSVYPNTNKKIEITKKCIESLKSGNRKIIMASHIPVDKELQNMVDYYIYDSYNPLIKHTLYNNYWYDTPDFRIDVLFEKLSKNNNLNQSLTVLNNIENCVRLCKNLGYKRIINVTYDYVFSNDDIKTIDKLSENIDNDRKRGYFMQFSDNNLDTFKTVFFIIDIDLFLEEFKNPRTPERFNEECRNISSDNFLERYFYKKLENRKNDLLIEFTTEEEKFKGHINIFSGVEYLTYVKVNNKPYTFVIWYSTNNDIDNRKIIIDYIINNIKTETFEHIVKTRTYFYKEIYVDQNENITFDIKIIDLDDNSILETYFIGPINRDNFDSEMENRGIMNIKKQNLDQKNKKITTVINYNTKNYSRLGYCIDSVKSLSEIVNITVSDHFSNGNPENMELLQKTFDEYHKDNINFMQYEFNSDLNMDSIYWDNVSRFIGSKYSTSDWLLLINSDEIIIERSFKDWLNNTELEYDAYLFSDNDSPLLIKRENINFNGDRLNIFNLFQSKKLINLESILKIKLFVK